MNRIINACFAILYICACQPDGKSPAVEPSVLTAETLNFSGEPELNTSSWQTYTNRKYNFSLEYPNGWWIAENAGKPGAPVINIYNVEFNGPFDLPLTMNADPQISHISFFPHGPNLKAASGINVSLNEVNAPITFAPDSINSIAYQLNDGQLWGYLLKPEVLPDNWTKDGFIFAQISVKNLKMKCFDESGKEKSITNCEPRNGDRIIRYGLVNKADRILIQHILSTLYFSDSKERRRPVLEFIQVDDLTANDTIYSPATIKGYARGIWFSEGRFTVILKDKNHKTISQSPAFAIEEWQTTGLVPFETKIAFDPSHSGQGYLLFHKEYPSGKAADERAYLLPVILGF